MVLPEQMDGAPTVAVDLPSFTSVALAGEQGASAGSEGDRLSAWISRWEASWLMEAQAGREERTLVYDRAIGPVAASITDSDVSDVLDGVSSAVALVYDGVGAPLPPAYQERVDEAASLVDWSRAELASGERAGALRGGLEAADRLRTVNPAALAEDLLARTEQARDETVFPASAGGGTSAREVERIDRLIRGARQALEDEDYHRAIRRAYYASQLLGVPAM